MRRERRFGQIKIFLCRFCIDEFFKHLDSSQVGKADLSPLLVAHDSNLKDAKPDLPDGLRV